MPQDPYSPYTHGANAPALASFPVAPSDADDLPTMIRAVTIGGAGTIAWVSQSGVASVTAALPAGTYAIRAARILATGTTATDITGWV